VLQFLGDEIYAVFGAPAPLADHASRALRAALQMRTRLSALNRSLEAERMPALRHGIGIHSGPVLAASLGSPDRRTYLLVGDTVNLASRLQRFASESGREIVLSAATHSLLAGDLRETALFKAIPPAIIKGKEAPVPVYEAGDA
jgi:adenylate cyclase